MCAVPSLPAHPRLQPRDLANCLVGLKECRALWLQKIGLLRAVPSLPAHPRLQPRDLANHQIGLKECRALIDKCALRPHVYTRSLVAISPHICHGPAALSSSRHSVPASVHVPPARVGAPCPRGPVHPWPTDGQPTERGRLCTKTETKQQPKPSTTDQQKIQHAHAHATPRRLAHHCSNDNAHVQPMRCARGMPPEHLARALIPRRAGQRLHTHKQIAHAGRAPT